MYTEPKITVSAENLAMKGSCWVMNWNLGMTIDLYEEETKSGISYI